MRIRHDEVMIVNNRLTQVGFSFSGDRRGRRIAVFECSCGVRKVMRVECIKSGQVKSCECLIAETRRKDGTHVTHGRSKDLVYNSWQDMKARCYNKRTPYYKYYGGRGIVVCDRWRNSFENFLADMGERPEGMSIERKENDGNYEPGNCVWATTKEQGRNRRDNRILTIDGVSQSVTEWAEAIGISRDTVTHRLNKGMSDRDAVLNPVDVRYSRR